MDVSPLLVSGEDMPSAKVSTPVLKDGWSSLVSNTSILQTDVSDITKSLAEFEISVGADIDGVKLAVTRVNNKVDVRPPPCGANWNALKVTCK